MVSPCPPSTNAVTFSTLTFSSAAMKVRKRAESSTPAMPMTRSRLKPGLAIGSLRHGVERIRHDDEDGLRRLRNDLCDHVRHDLEIGVQQVIAAHARLARNAGSNDHDVGVGRGRVVVGAE